MEKAREFRRPLYICFIDPKGAYNSVNSHSYNLPDKLLSIIHALHENSRAAVRAYGKTSEELLLPVVSVRIVCWHPPCSTSISMYVAIRMALEDHRLQGWGVRVAYLHNAKLVGNRSKLQLESIITDLTYADGLYLVADSWDDLKRSCWIPWRHAVKTSTSAVRKIFAVTPSDSQARPKPIPDDVPAKVVPHFQYLGSIVQDDCGSTLEVDPRRLQKPSYP